MERAKEYMEEYLINKEKITIEELLKECFKLDKTDDNRYKRIIIGKILNKLGWHKHQGSNGERYYNKEKRDSYNILIKNLINAKERG